MHSSIRALFGSLLVTTLLFLAGCSREEGESCQDQRDCEDGLICTNMDEERGVCIRPEDVEIDEGREDSGLSTIEEGVDAGTDDAGADDAGG